MSTLKNIFNAIKFKAEELATTALRVVMEGYRNTIMPKLKLRDCIRRADRSYYILTEYEPPNAISKRQLEEVIMSSDTQNLLSNLKANCATTDYLYITLLALAIANVYKPQTPPQFLFSGNSNLLK